ncbi:alpha/beta fold hydrolase [Paraburkholderia sp. BCC1886]|uniref:alpha/beta fold hydrolase n=1 Tax=Paraburkholderia sp. BCC1886 TaxID=2562670 RepID=UPI0011827499|nr:alpha/beta hydrolase [Paraburkholderia sp. BCC1886]
MSTWILLRGLTRETRHWGALPDTLQRTLGSTAPLLLDLPGNGEFSHLAAPSSVGAMVEFVRNAAAARGAVAPFRVLAMSLGGMVATEWAQRYPGEIERLVLVNTSMRPFSRMTERLRPRAWPRLLAVAVHWRDALRVERGIHRLTCKRVTTLSADLEAWCGIRHNAPVSRANALWQLWAAARFTAAPTRPACALLILSSSGDGLVDPVCSVKLAAAWRAAHCVHPWAGHDLPHDDPGWMSGRISEWLAHS